MTPFLKWAAAYLFGSLLLNGLMFLQGRAALRLFRKEFPGHANPDELTAEERQQWIQLSETRFQSGFWRLITVVYSFYHYPGIALNAIRQGDTVSAATMFFASLTVWLTIITLVTKPWKS